METILFIEDIFLLITKSFCNKNKIKKAEKIHEPLVFT